MKQICVLLNGAIVHDSRVIKTIRTLSTVARVDLFYINGSQKDKEIFSDNVRLFSIKKKENFKTKIIKHSCFYNEFLFFIPNVLKQNIKYDFIWSNDLPCLKPGVIIKNKLGSKLIYDSHEIYVETINQFYPSNTNFIKKNIFAFLIRLMRFLGTRFENKALQSVNHFITVGNELKKYFINKYKYQNINVIMNCPPVNTNIDTIQLKNKLQLNDNVFLVLYQGGLNSGRGLVFLIESMQYVFDGIQLLILGNGTLKSELIELTKKYNLETKIIFKDAVPQDELSSYTKAADVGINLLEDFNLSKKFAIPNKLFEYIHANIPIIASNVPENKNIIEKYNLGCLVENNPDDIAEAINKMAGSDLSIYKENCKKAAMEYNWENQEKIILQIINSK